MPEDERLKYLGVVLGLAGAGIGAYLLARAITPPVPTPPPPAPTPAPAPPSEMVVEAMPTPTGETVVTPVSEATAPPGELSIEDLYLSAREIDEGGSVTIFVVVRNIGESPTSGAVELNANGTHIGTYGTGTLQPGESTTITARWTPPEGGKYYLIEATL